MKYLLSTTALAAVVAFGAAQAQEYGTEGTAAGEAAQVPPEQQVVWTEHEGELLSSELIGAEVVNHEDETLGEIESLLISLVTDAGMADTPSGANAMPPKSDAPIGDSAASDSAPTAEAPADDLAAGEDPLEDPLAGEAPATDGQSDDLAADQAPANDGQSDDFATGEMPGEAQQDAQGEQGDSMAAGEPAGDHEYDAAASAPQGESVIEPSGARQAHAEVTDVVIGVGGFLGIGEKLVNVPITEMEVFSSGSGSYKIVYNATAEQLENLPAFVNRDDGISQGSQSLPQTAQ